MERTEILRNLLICFSNFDEKWLNLREKGDLILSFYSLFYSISFSFQDFMKLILIVSYQLDLWFINGSYFYRKLPHTDLIGTDGTWLWESHLLIDRMGKSEWCHLYTASCSSLAYSFRMTIARTDTVTLPYLPNRITFSFYHFKASFFLSRMH